MIVDFQNDFTPGGTLGVEGGHEIADALNQLAVAYENVFATRDWHPPDHGSFEGSPVDEDRWDGTEPPNIWPVHCVEGTEGAELHPALDRSKVDVVIDKGQDLHSQGYSGFQDTNLAELLRERGVDRIAVGGLTTDYCVKNTVLDALKEGFEVTVIEDAIRAVNAAEGDEERAIEEMKAAGAQFATSEGLLRSRGD